MTYAVDHWTSRVIWPEKFSKISNMVISENVDVFGVVVLLEEQDAVRPRERDHTKIDIFSEIGCHTPGLIRPYVE